ncbi:uncharacterized protein LOC133188392 [Saccostrea echinata]|uniref:uncharacterized protein LOC133188392 n=1 Tax=Saccostrea echinata TaxID=191078 RepID=UPI002A829830|nr:uncharacterized protein LOC133188392 [Saccostrea echinata]
MKKSNFVLAFCILFGIGMLYFHMNRPSTKNTFINVNSLRQPEPVAVNSSHQESVFDPTDSKRYEKYLTKYTPGYDKNCMLTLPNKYIGEGDFPLKLPGDNELNSLSDDVISCLYHRYVTTIQTFCAFKDRAGEVKRNGWYICADPAYIPKQNCIVFLSNKAFPESAFSADMVSRYKCQVHRSQFSTAETLKSWMEKTNTGDRIVDIFTMSINRTSDFAFIKTMIKDKSIKKVKQLLLELHFDPKVTKTEEYIQILKHLRLIYNEGLRIVWFDRLIHCATNRFNKCYAIYFVQPNLRDKTKGTAVVNFPTVAAIQKMKGNEIANLYFKYIETTQFFCQHILRIGRITDGGWDVCHDRMMQYKNPCLVYSFGVFTDLSFDDEVSATYNCKVYAFDPTTPFGTHQHAPKVWFYRLGIGTKYSKFSHGYVAPLQKIRSDLHHQSSSISILKADVEGAEWSSVPHMIDTNQLHDVSQLFLEFHGWGDSPNQLILLKKLHDAGFRIFWYHINPACTFNKNLPRRSRCQEVYFINTKFQPK